MRPSPPSHQADPQPIAEPWQADISWLTDALAVGGCFPMEQAGHLARTLGISAVIDLREETCDDEKILSREGVAFLHLPTPDMAPATQEKLDRGVAFATAHLTEGRKVLIHCQHGIGRSALLALCLLVDRGHEPLQALNLAKDRREKVSPSLTQYQGWADWLARRGAAAPDYDTFGRIAYRHLAGG